MRQLQPAGIYDAARALGVRSESSCALVPVALPGAIFTVDFRFSDVRRDLFRAQG